MRSFGNTRSFLGFGLALFGVAALAGAQAPAAEKKAESKAPAKMEAKAPAKKMAMRTGHLMAAGDLKWVDVEAVKGAQQAVLWGDPNKGASGTLNKWPGGTDVGAHTHSADSKGVLLSGTLVMTLRGGPEKELGPGSYVHILGNEVHSTKCKEGADCEFFVVQPGKFDFKPVKPAAEKK